MNKGFNNIYTGKKVLITGHTGFKGSWLALWLNQLGAKVYGFSLDKPTTPCHLDLLRLEEESITSYFGDIGDYDKVEEVIQKVQPAIIFHLAAQSLVRPSYTDPLNTLKTNILGTANILEASRKSKSLKAIVNITSDKCYENREDNRPFKETDPMGGYDPYSCSKGAAELVANSYRNSFFNITDYQKSHQILIANVRAGNVIGGGDWSADRLIPDIIRAASKKDTVQIRNPNATRPWQHVLDPLNGYLLLGQKLLEERVQFSGGWNFGPADNTSLTVGEVARIAKAIWEDIHIAFDTNKNHPHEANTLRLDCTKSITQLNWQPTWTSVAAIQFTINWYKKIYLENKVNSLEDLSNFIETRKLNFFSTID